MPPRPAPSRSSSPEPEPSPEPAPSRGGLTRPITDLSTNRYGRRARPRLRRDGPVTRGSEGRWPGPARPRPRGSGQPSLFTSGLRAPQRSSAASCTTTSGRQPSTIASRSSSICGVVRWHRGRAVLRDNVVVAGLVTAPRGSPAPGEVSGSSASLGESLSGFRPRGGTSEPQEMTFGPAGATSGHVQSRGTERQPSTGERR